MLLKEAAALLGWNPESVSAAITAGIRTPVTKRFLKLKSAVINGEHHISDAQLQKFIDAFEAEEPGRHPPVHVRRELLVEAGHLCAICTDSAPLQFHHIIEFAELKHHDPSHMLAVCGTCHSKITLRQIDTIAQRMYKDRLGMRRRLVGRATDALTADSLLRFSWTDLRGVIVELRTAVDANDRGQSAYDFSEIGLDEKNRLNVLGREYFELMRQHHEPYFGRIQRFLLDPVNVDSRETYYQVVDELRTKIAAGRAHFASFEEMLLRFVELAVQDHPDSMKKHRALLTVLLSFMYFNCDIGRKL